MSPPASLDARPAAQAYRVALPGSLAPEEAVLWLRGERHPFALVGEWLGGGCLIGSDPLRVAGPHEDPFALLDELPVMAAGGDAVVGGGWVGWLGYGLGARIERLPPPPPAPVPAPPFGLAFYDHLVRHDGERWWFEALPSPGRETVLAERLALWRDRLAGPPPRRRPVALTAFRLAGDGPGGHVAAVEDCRERIAAGEIFQANVCLRLEAACEGDAVDLFARALPAAAPRFGALVDGAVSLSPERFLSRRGRVASTEPIKGTRPRVGAAHAQQLAREALVASDKDAAEHVMIVDLMRNDLGRVCAYGSVRAGPPRAEPHAGVWHLVSTVSGELRDGVGDGALLRATFPPGSVTGAPKVQAMKVIAALEATRRELYTGAIGIVSPLAGLDLSVAIRTFELRDGRIWFGAGGGIVADSDPEHELAEALTKAAGPVAAIGGELAGAGDRLVDFCPSWDKSDHTTGGRGPRRGPGTGRARRRDARLAAALDHGPRPDPAAGVFETVLVCEGEAVALGAHVARLTASLAAVYGSAPPSDLAGHAAARAAAAGAARARLRLLADPDGSVALSVKPEPEPKPEATPVRLMPWRLPGGLGAHKWRDRRLLDGLAAAAPGTVPLLVAGDGLVLEAAYANLWLADERGALLTPPADGRILPGVTRAALLGAGPNAREAAIDLGDLPGADLFLTSSIAGRRPAQLA